MADNAANNNTSDPLVNETLEQISLFPSRPTIEKAWIPKMFSKTKDLTKSLDFDNKLGPSTLISPEATLSVSASNNFREKNESFELLKISDLHPRRVANIENLLQSATPGNGLLRGWSSLSTGGLNSFHRYLQSNNLNNDEKFVVICHVRCLGNWLEAWQIKVGLRTNEILRIHQGRLPVIINTEILLKPEATATDFFHATIIVNRILYEFKQLTEDADIDRAAGLLTTLPASEADRLIEVDKSGFDTAFVDKLRCNAMKFEKTNARDIRLILSQAEWDLRSFSFGSLDVRVNWQTQSL